MRFLAAFLGAFLPCWAVTIHGNITAEKELAVVNAQIVILNEVSLIIAQRTFSDRSGKYVLSVEPGPYMLCILKEGFKPISKRFNAIDPKTNFEFSHQLEPTLTLTENEHLANTKRILRNNNRDPRHDIKGELLAAWNFSPVRDESLMTSLTTQSRRDLAGNPENLATIEVQTQIKTGLKLHSSFTDHRRVIGPSEAQLDTQQITAALSYNQEGRVFGIEAETIQQPNALEDGHSESLGISGSFGREVKSTSEVAYSQSVWQEDAHRQVSLTEQIDYSVSGMPITHRLGYTGWSNEQETVAQQASLATSWMSKGPIGLGIHSELNRTTLPGQNLDATRVWISGEHRSTGQGLFLAGQIGFQSGDSERGIIQKHRLSWQNDWLAVAAEYEHDYQIRSFNSIQIYGPYLASPQIPYAMESFYSTNGDHSRISAKVHHGRFQSELAWAREADKAELLFAVNAGPFRSNSRQLVNSYGYILSAPRFGSRLEIHRRNNENDDHRFDQTEFVYAQTLYPFGDGGMTLLVQLEVRDHPSIPAWWLLSDLPTNVQQADRWYEGKLSLHF